MTKGTSIAGRKENDGIDFYETPIWCIEKLLEYENFTGNILEPASGNGAISKVLEQKGYKVISKDLRNDDNVYGEGGQDFLQSINNYDNIITNPPFCLAEDFIKKSLSVSSSKVVMFLKLQFLESSGRYDFFKNTPLKKVYVLSKRPTLYPANGPVPKNKGTIAYAWYVWEKGYEGPTVLDWIV